MKLKQKIIAALSVSFIGLAGALCFYNQVAVYKNAVKTQFSNQRVIAQSLKNAIEGNIGQLQFAENQKYGPALSNFQFDALDKFNKTEDKQDILDYAAFQYFADSNASNQFFEINKDLEQTEDCLELFKIPLKDKDAVLDNLKKFNVEINKYWCKTNSKNSFIGFKLEETNYKSYMYVEKLSSSMTYQTFSFKDSLAKIDFSKLIDSSNLNVTLIDNKLNIIKSTDTKFNRQDIQDDLFTTATNSSYIEDETNSDKISLTTIVYLNDLDVFAVVQSPKGTIVKPIITNNFIIALLCALIFIFLSYVVSCFLNKLKKELVDISNNVNVMATSVLVSPKEMEQITAKIDVNKIKFTNIANLATAISSLGRSITENITSKVQELENKAKVDSKEAAENSKIELISQMHKNLMPDGSDMPTSKFLDIASFIIPSKTNPTDFYDIFKIDKDNIGIVFGSCSKTGSEAINAINLSTNFIRKSLITDTLLPGQTVTELNKLLMQRDRKDFNVSIFVMILSEFTGNFIYSVAGIKTPTLVHLHKGAVLEPKVTMQELCTDKNLVYVDSKGKFTYLDTLWFIGKGIENAVNSEGQTYNYSKILEIAQKKADDTATDQLIAAYKDCKDFSGDAVSELDICAIVVKKNANNKEFDEDYTELNNKA